MKNKINIGELAQSIGIKDAIHIPIVSITASKVMKPGEPLDIPGVSGIIDPFLPEPARPGDNVWVLVNPKTISNLRHEWESEDIDIGFSDPDFELEESCCGEDEEEDECSAMGCG